MNEFECIKKITFQVRNGFDIGKAADAAYRLSILLDKPVSFMINDREYAAMLQINQVGGPP